MSGFFPFLRYSLDASFDKFDVSATGQSST